DQADGINSLFRNGRGDLGNINGAGAQLHNDRQRGCLSYCLCHIGAHLGIPPKAETTGTDIWTTDVDLEACNSGYVIELPRHNREIINGVCREINDCRYVPLLPDRWVLLDEPVDSRVLET